jgi:hypothetical protein
VLVIRRLPPALALFLGVSLLLLVGSPAGSSSPVRSVASSQAFAVRILVPNQPAVTAGYVAAPSTGENFQAGFAYPADGTIISTGTITSTASAVTTPTSFASSSTEVATIALFGGEVTIERVDAKVTASVGKSAGTGDFTGTAVTGVAGSAVAGNQLGNWGTLTLGTGTGETITGNGAYGWHGSVPALDIKLTLDHGGLPAGTEILIGYAAASVQSPQPEATPAPAPPPGIVKTPLPRAAERTVDPRGVPRLPIGKIPTVQPKLTAGRYVFPIYGAASYVDTFGAPRADVSWHHGDDIFAPLGAPILAVADGTLFSVGWNKIGGWRLWLRDGQGNEFYYAHLSAFSPFARNKAFVRAGTVIGFVGDSGDAKGTPYHLHFEVHPVALLPLDYDGAVDPTPYLDAWRRLEDIQFSTSGAWLPGLARLRTSHAPEPGAILLQINDISSASGLDPGSLQRALAPVAREGDGALVGGFSPPTNANVKDLGRG